MTEMVEIILRKEETIPGDGRDDFKDGRNHSKEGRNHPGDGRNDSPEALSLKDYKI